VLFSPIRSIVFCKLAPIYFVGTVFNQLLFWGAVIAIPINFFVFGVGYHIGDASLQILSIFNIALLSTQFLKGDEE
jgi:hypothetical protein